MHFLPFLAADGVKKNLRFASPTQTVVDQGEGRLKGVNASARPRTPSPSGSSSPSPHKGEQKTPDRHPTTTSAADAKGKTPKKDKKDGQKWNSPATEKHLKDAFPETSADGELKVETFEFLPEFFYLVAYYVTC